MAQYYGVCGPRSSFKKITCLGNISRSRRVLELCKVKHYRQDTATWEKPRFPPSRHSNAFFVSSIVDYGHQVHQWPLEHGFSFC